MIAAGKGRLSASKVSCHPYSGGKYACLRLYRGRYVTKRAPYRATAAMARGTLVHKALELAARARVDGAAPLPEAGVDELLAYLRLALPQVAGAVTGRGLAEAREALELAAPVDFSHTVAVESRWTLDLGEVELEGVVDRVDDVPPDSEHGTGEVLVYDYKTAGAVEDEEALEDAPQTLFYLAAMRERYPGAPRIGMVYDYLSRDWRARPVWWTPERDAQARALGLSVWRDVQERVARDAAGEDPEATWPGTTGPQCQGCPLRSGCPAYNALLLSGDDAAPPPATMSTAALIAEHRRALDAQNLNKARKSEVAEELDRRIGTGSEVEGDGLRAYRVVTPNRELHEASAVQGIAAALQTTPEAVRASLTREVLDKSKIEQLVANLDEATRAAVTKAVDAAKYTVSTSAHVRTAKARANPFGG